MQHRKGQWAIIMGAVILALIAIVFAIMFFTKMFGAP